jgi:rod shape-determining protein MreD
LTPLLLLTVALLQTSALPGLSPWGVVPDLMLLMVVSWSLLRGARAGIPWALVGGLLLDLLSEGPFGAATVSLTLSGVVAGLEQLNLFRDSPWLPVFASSLSTTVYYGIYLVILWVTGRPLLLAPGLVRVVVPCMILNALAMYPTFWAVRWLHRRTLPAG